MADTKELIRKYGIRMTKSLGQNFLISGSTVGQIVDAADVNERDLVIEVGPGVGTMTRELAERAGRLVAVEIDKRLIPAIDENLQGFLNTAVVNMDILKTDLKALIEDNMTGWNLTSVKVVANLPYYITTPIIMKFLEEAPGIDCMVFMVQKEVADRMAAAPGGKDYGSLSVAVQYYSKVEKVFEVPPHCFKPQPEVDSMVVRMNIYKDAPVKLLDRDMFFKVVKASFGQRRKTLANALYNSGYFMTSKDEIIEILKNIGIEAGCRGETLSISQFAELANSLSLKSS